MSQARNTDPESCLETFEFTAATKIIDPTILVFQIIIHLLPLENWHTYPIIASLPKCRKILKPWIYTAIYVWAGQFESGREPPDLSGIPNAKAIRFPE